MQDVRVTAWVLFGTVLAVRYACASSESADGARRAGAGSWRCARYGREPGRLVWSVDGGDVAGIERCQAGLLLAEGCCGCLYIAPANVHISIRCI
jgi:hypothetical protein